MSEGRFIGECHSCKHWARNNVDYKSADLKPCYHPKMQSSGWHLDGIDATDCGNGCHEPENCFLCGPAFGCIHHEAKDKE